MKNLILLFTLAVMCWGCGTQPVTDADEKKSSGHLIKEKSLGSIHAGDKINVNVEDYVVKKIMEYDERGEMSTIFEYRQKGEVIFRIIPQYENEDSIATVQVLSNICKTEKGIGIGSTLIEFTETYPEFNFWYEFDTGLVIETTELNGIYFSLNYTGGIQTFRALDLNDVNVLDTFIKSNNALEIWMISIH